MQIMTEEMLNVVLKDYKDVKQKYDSVAISQKELKGKMEKIEKNIIMPLMANEKTKVFVIDGMQIKFVKIEKVSIGYKEVVDFLLSKGDRIKSLIESMLSKVSKKSITIQGKIISAE